MRDRLLFLNRWPQHHDGRRWENGLARPEDLIDHERYDVTYLCDEPGRSAVPAGARDVHLVDLSRWDDVLALVDRLVAGGARFHRVLALSEYLLDLAAAIRERHDVGGPRPAETDRFRDKTLMKTIVARAGIRVPRWFAAKTPDQVLADAAALGYPLVLKPARGASSQGVRVVASEDELRGLCAGPDLEHQEIEEYVTGDVLHADGVVDADGRLLFVSVSRYVADCLAFEHGEPFGSVIQTDPAVRAAAEDFTRACLSALDLRASAFHLEFFDTGRELVFLEIGARVAGADVSYVIEEVSGVNLFRLWTDVVLGHPVRPAHRTPPAGGAWLMVPRPRPLPRRVVEATPLLGRIPHLYRELVPRPGEVLEHTGGYATLQGGRFLFRGGTQDELTAAVRQALATYRLTTVPV